MSPSRLWTAVRAPHARPRFEWLFLAAWLGGCTVMPPTVIPPPPDTTPIAKLQGIAGAYSGDAKPIRILFIHGMGTAPTDYCTPAELIKNLTLALGVPTQEPAQKSAITCDNGIVVPAPRYISASGAVAPAELYTYKFGGPSGRKIQFSFLLWAPMTYPLKGNLDETGHPDWAWVTKESKGFFQSHLSDVVLYAGAYRIPIRTVVEKAMCLFLDGKSDDDTGHDCKDAVRGVRTVVITHSLGSYIFADAVADLRVAHAQFDHGVPHEFDNHDNSKNDAGAVILESTDLVYMLANQLAMLDLTTTGQPSGGSVHGYLPCRQLNVAQDTETAEAKGVMRSLLDHWRCGHEPQGNPLQQIVAFSDPDDLLTYMVSKDNVQASVGDDPTVVANVYLGVAPTYLGLFANPFDAHLNYLTDPTVIRIMTCGMTGNDVNAC